MIVPILLAGGTGERLWPVSTPTSPKQLLRLTGENSLFQQTVIRTQALSNVSPPVILCQDEHRFVIAEQLRQLDLAAHSILLEPACRNTAPAVASAALWLNRDSEDPLLLICPVDHAIENLPAFQQAMTTGAEIADSGAIVIFSIRPTHAESGYGYIRQGASIHGTSSLPAYKMTQFIEKPTISQAEELISNQFQWNSGILMCRSSALLKALESDDSSLVNRCRRAVDNAEVDQDFVRLNQEYYRQNPSRSLDKAVLEKVAGAAAIPLDVGWKDLGTWDVISKLGHKTEGQNITTGRVHLQECNNNYVAAKDRTIQAIGLHDCIVIETDEGVLICKKGMSSKVKRVT